MKRVMNFSQPMPWRETLPYSIVVPREELLALLEKAHARTIQELIDDEPYDEGDDEVVNALRAARWPRSLAAIEPELAGHYIRRYLSTEALDALATARPDDPPEFQLNTLERVVIDGDGVELRGECVR